MEEARKKREIRVHLFEVMADLAIANEGTPSMIDEVDDDIAPLGHVSNQIKVEHDDDGIPIGSPNRIDSVAKTTMEDPMSRAEIMCYTGSKKKNLTKAVQKSWSCSRRSLGILRT